MRPLETIVRRVFVKIFRVKRITEQRLEKCGFIYKDLGGMSPYETWEKHGIIVWAFYKFCNW